MRRFFAVLLLLIACWQSAAAVQPDEILADPRLEARARSLSAELRCLVCQNQSIDDSDAPLARDLRLLIRDRLKAGDEDGEVLSFLVARYGEFVLLRPSFAPHTLLLWLGPFAVFALGLIAVLRLRKTSSPITAEQPLNEAESRRVSELMEGRG